MIIILDETMNKSYQFVAIRQGFLDAAAKIREIKQQGHVVGGDIGRVAGYLGISL